MLVRDLLVVGLKIRVNLSEVRSLGQVNYQLWLVDWFSLEITRLVIENCLMHLGLQSGQCDILVLDEDLDNQGDGEVRVIVSSMELNGVELIL